MTAGAAEPGGPWVAVTDALPEPYVPVLICQAAGAVSALTAVHVAHYSPETRKFSKPLEPGTVRLYHRVTHWMPLPGLQAGGAEAAGAAGAAGAGGSSLT